MLKRYTFTHPLRLYLQTTSHAVFSHTLTCYTFTHPHTLYLQTASHALPSLSHILILYTLTCPQVPYIYSTSHATPPSTLTRYTFKHPHTLHFRAPSHATPSSTLTRCIFTPPHTLFIHPYANAFTFRLYSVKMPTCNPRFINMPSSNARLRVPCVKLHCRTQLYELNFCLYAK